jgi:long-chain acyl-CoA synthetase
MSIQNRQNAAQILFDQAARPDLRDEPRFMVPVDRGFVPVTWGECATRVERVASFLMDRGVDRDCKVAVLSETRLEWGIAGLAAGAARGVLVPVYPTLVGEPLAHILAHSDARVLFVENAEQLARVLLVWDQLGIETLITFEPLDLDGLARNAGLDPDPIVASAFSLAQVEQGGEQALARNPARVRERLSQITLDDVASLIYTSGTTGLPKGVLLSHRNVAVNGADWLALNGPLLRQGDLDVLWLPMSHIFGWGQFGLGNQLGFVTYFSTPTLALQHLADLAPHLFMSVPLYWQKLAGMARAVAPDAERQHAELRRLTGGRLRFCLSGGAGLEREVKEFFKAAGIMIIEGYGLTECSPTLTMNRIDDYDFSSVGKPYPSVRLKLAADGEILTKGEHVFLGYHKDPEATRSMFDQQGWLKTGDLGRFNEGGYLQIIGRKKEILVTAGGKNIPPENIERHFRDDPLIARLVVFGDGKKYLTALVDIDDQVARARLLDAGLGETSRGGSAQMPAMELRRHPKLREWIEAHIKGVNRTLAPYETVKAFCVADEPLTVAAGMLTPSLKVRRNQVYQRYRQSLESLYG